MMPAPVPHAAAMPIRLLHRSSMNTLSKFNSLPGCGGKYKLIECQSDKSVEHEPELAWHASLNEHDKS